MPAPPQVSTCRPDGTGRGYLGELGHVTGLTYSTTMPGGARALSCTLQADPSVRTDLLDPGRTVRVHRGGSWVWEGTLAEPVPGEDGWTVTAAGAGTYGDAYRDVWTSWTADNVVDTAIGRGLAWTRPASLAGGELSEQTDTAASTVTEFLDSYTSPAGKIWQVKGPANAVSVSALPSAVTRLLVATVPQARTLAGVINALYVRYMITADTSQGAAATFGLTSATLPDSIARHGRMEAYWDLEPAGVLSASAAQAKAAAALSKYRAASWAGPFEVRHGQYLTSRGSPVDLACETAGQVARLVLADGPYGGETYPAPPVSFPVAATEYRADDGILTITPYLAVTSDWEGLLASLTPKPRA